MLTALPLVALLLPVTADAATASPTVPGSAVFAPVSRVIDVAADGSLLFATNGGTALWVDGREKAIASPSKNGDALGLSDQGAPYGYAWDPATAQSRAQTWRRDGGVAATFPEPDSTVRFLANDGTALISRGPGARFALWTPGSPAVDLTVPELGDAVLTVSDMNNRHEVAAVAHEFGTGRDHPVRCSAAGVCQVLSTPAGGEFLAVHAINDTGRVLGSLGDNPSDPARRGVVWDGTAARLLPTAAGASYASPVEGRGALNARGDVLGYSGPGTRVFDSPVVWPAAGGAPVPLAKPSGNPSLRVTAINDSGDVAGYTSLGDVAASDKVLFWRGGALSQFALLPLRNRAGVTGLSNTGRIGGLSSVKIDIGPWPALVGQATYWDAR
ncbi:hypothetical protein BJP25_06315 [Actinokineospora bangkokensis]|uniref:Uncharacterized protein n=1 Tax=Actinokineospora bangkokensis TaxID=1193682 RepID=A0A1Q9LTJ7_9PSEU|nr:hypothetical protein BJP25_06315 [Actinokineospora bangkokensis]